ncbi:hypothetical protein EDB83DRAFT_2312833 [Lactarius deliciosus]|nr:hypothetical protein EDB83DRAFT_2312833 [Lactarius deliciosus]
MVQTTAVILSIRKNLVWGFAQDAAVPLLSHARETYGRRGLLGSNILSRDSPINLGGGVVGLIDSALRCSRPNRAIGAVFLCEVTSEEPKGASRISIRRVYCLEDLQSMMNLSSEMNHMWVESLQNSSYHLFLNPELVVSVTVTENTVSRKPTTKPDRAEMSSAPAAGYGTIMLRELYISKTRTRNLWRSYRRHANASVSVVDGAIRRFCGARGSPFVATATFSDTLVLLLRITKKDAYKTQRLADNPGSEPLAVPHRILVRSNPIASGDIIPWSAHAKLMHAGLTVRPPGANPAENLI